MTVAIHNTTVTAGPVSVTSRGILHTATAGAVLLVWVQTNKAVSVSNIAINTHNLGRLGLVSAGTTTFELWAHTGPAGGILTISAALVGTTSGNFAMIAQSFTGAKNYQSNPFGTVVGGTAGAATTLNLSVSTSATDVVAFGFGVSANTTLTINGTTDGTATLSTLGRMAVGHIAGGTAAVSVSAAAGASNQMMGLAVPIIASSIATTSLAFDNAAFTGTSTVSNTFGLLLTATSNACLIVFVNTGGDNQTVSAINVGALAMTFKGTVHYRNAGSAVGELWVLTAPPSGILTISGIAVGAKTGAWAVGGVTYTGHKTTGDPFGGIAATSTAQAATAAISISSTAGNLAIAFFGHDAGASTSAAAGVSLRLQTNNLFPGMIIADVAGATARTISVGAAGASTNWGGLGLNLIQSGVAATISAVVAFTDVADKFTAVAGLRITGSMAKTDAPDIFSASANVRITGLLAATDAQDKFTAVGALRITGSMARTDAPDVFSSSAQVRITASLVATDRPDTFSASSQLRVTGRLSATDAPDIFSASAQTVFNAGAISAVAAFTDAPDAFSASGYAVIAATITASDRPDLFSAQVATTSAPPNVVRIDDSAGGGHERADESFWEAREKYLLSLQPEIDVEPEPEIFPEPAGTAEPISSAAQPSTLLLDLRNLRLNAVAAVQQAPTIPKLHVAGERLRSINQRILNLKRTELFEAQARVAAIQSAIARRRAYVEREKARLRKKLALLQIAHSLLLLQDHT